MRRFFICPLLVALTALTLTASVTAAPVQAIVGPTFGVASLDLRLPAGDLGVLPGSRAFTVSEPNGRVLYPAFRQGAVERILGADGSAPGSVTVFFLFRGTEPFDVTVATPSVQTFRITPRADRPRVFDRELRRWWRFYRAAMRQQRDDSDYPPLVETYLASMLTRRLNLDDPLIDRIQGRLSGNNRPSSEGQKTIELLTGIERLRLETLRRQVSEPASRPKKPR